MLPIKIRNHLKKLIGNKAYLTVSKKSLIEYFSEYEDNDVVKIIFKRYGGTLTKIILHQLNGKVKVNIITDNVDVRALREVILTNPSNNYHDYLMEFIIDRTHFMYDLIIEVKYRYVYD